MAPWWAKDSHKETSVVVKMENPNWSMVELEGPSEDDFLIGDNNTPIGSHEKTRGKNAKQLTWALLLKVHRAAGFLTSVGSTLISFAFVIRRRVVSGQTDDNYTETGENRTFKTGFYNCIKAFLWLSLLFFGFEIAAFFKGWHFGPANLQLQYILSVSLGVKDLFDWSYTHWVLIRVGYLAPPLQFLANVCIILFLIQSMDRLVSIAKKMPFLLKILVPPISVGE